MTTVLSMTRDANGYNSFGVQPADGKYGGILAANTEQHITLPSTFAKYNVIFSPDSGADIWVGYNVTAALPTGTMGAVNCERNPTSRTVAGGTILSFITSDSSVAMGFVIYGLS